MSSRSSVRALAALLAGAAVLALAGQAWADQDRLARTQAECDKIRAEFQDANHKAQQFADAEMKLLTMATSSVTDADAIRKMKAWELGMRRQKMESELKKLMEQREEEDRGAAFSKLDPQIASMRAIVNALKDAELRAQDLEETGGMGTSDRNALDSYAQEMRDRAAKAKARQEEWTRKGKDGHRLHQDCLAELDRQRASLDGEDEGEQWASAAGGGDDGTATATATPAATTTGRLGRLSAGAERAAAPGPPDPAGRLEPAGRLRRADVGRRRAQGPRQWRTARRGPRGRPRRRRASRRDPRRRPRTARRSPRRQDRRQAGQGRQGRPAALPHQSDHRPAALRLGLEVASSPSLSAR